MTKDEFRDWKNHPVTEKVMEMIKELIEDGKNELAVSAGQDPVHDRYRVGKIMGLATFLNMEADDVDD